MRLILFNEEKVCAFEDIVSLLYINGLDDTVTTTVNVVLHLHGFEDNSHITGLDRLTNGNVDAEDGAWERRLGSTLSMHFILLGCRGSNSGVGWCCGARNDRLGTFCTSRLVEFNGVCLAVDFDFDILTVDVLDGNFVLVAIDFHFIGLHQ